MTQPGIPDIDLNPPLTMAFEAIEAGMRQAAEKFNEIVERVRELCLVVPPPVLLWIRDRLDVCREMVQEVLDKAGHALDHQIPVLALVSTSFAWLEQVRRPVSGLSARVATPESPAIGAWSGAAADAYRGIVDRQQAAALDVAEKANLISGWLYGIVTANIDYAIELARIVTQLVGRLAETAIEIGAVVTLPWAVEALAEAIGELLTAGLDNLLSIAERFVDAIGNVRNVHASLSDHSKLPGGNWPAAVRN